MSPVARRTHTRIGLRLAAVVFVTLGAASPAAADLNGISVNELNPPTSMARPKTAGDGVGSCCCSIVFVAGCAYLVYQLAYGALAKREAEAIGPIGPVVGGAGAVLLVTVFLIGTVPLLTRFRPLGVTPHETASYLANYRGLDTIRFLPESRMTIHWLDEEAHQRDWERLRQLFPADADFRVALRWGADWVALWKAEYAFVIEQWKLPTPETRVVPINSPKAVAAVQELAAVPATEQLSAHAALSRLLAARGSTLDDLRRLRSLVRGAAGGEAEYERLSRWAAGRIARKAEPVPRSPVEGPGDDIDFGYTLAPPTPDTPWFRDWVLYDDWAITAPVFEARTAAVVAGLADTPSEAKSIEGQILKSGRRLAAERGRADPDFPAGDDRAAWVAFLERVTYLDGRRGKLETALPLTTGADWKAVVGLAVWPNRDSMRDLSADLWERPPAPFDDAVPKGASVRPLYFRQSNAALASSDIAWLVVPMLLVGFALYQGSYWVCVRLPGLAFGLRGDPAFENLCRETGSAGRVIAGVITSAVLTAVVRYVMPFALNGDLQLYVRDPGTQFCLSVWTGIFCGFLLTSAKRLGRTALVIARYAGPNGTALRFVLPGVVALGLLVVLGVSVWALLPAIVVVLLDEALPSRDVAHELPVTERRRGTPRRHD